MFSAILRNSAYRLYTQFDYFLKFRRALKSDAFRALK
ncbi:uncharacterized protein METZ01_LOCUS476373, partial [marine metagenome]